MELWKGTLRDDVMRTYELLHGGFARKIIGCLLSPGVQMVVVFRFGQWLRAQPKVLRLFLEPIYLVLNALMKIMWGIELPRSANIGSGLYIGHFGGITISPSAVIGKRCNLSQGVTIGVSGEGDKRGVPIIGDDVYIAPGVKLFGKINVGNNCKIGANAVIHKDIPDNAIVVLDPGFKVISYKGNRKSENNQIT